MTKILLIPIKCIAAILLTFVGVTAQLLGACPILVVLAVIGWMSIVDGWSSQMSDDEFEADFESMRIYRIHRPYYGY